MATLKKASAKKIPAKKAAAKRAPAKRAKRGDDPVVGQPGKGKGIKR